jgi:hypothetical protein
MKWGGHPKPGTIRVRTKFAWFPIFCLNGDFDGGTCWLEYVRIEEEEVKLVPGTFDLKRRWVATKIEPLHPPEY